MTMYCSLCMGRGQTCSYATDMCTKLGVDSSSRFSFRAHTHRHTITNATDHCSHATATVAPLISNQLISTPEMQVTEHGVQSVNALTTQSDAHWTEQFRDDAGVASDGQLTAFDNADFKSL